MSRTRALVMALASGVAALGLWAVSLPLFDVSRRWAEYGLLTAPALLFPLAAVLLTRAGALRWWGALVVTSAFFVTGAMGLSAIAGTRALALAPLVLLTVAASAVASFDAERPRRRVLAVLAPAVSLAAAVLMVPTLGASMLTAPGEATLLPELGLRLADGRPVPLRSFAGRVLVMNFWGVHCEPCVRELPALEAVAHALEPRGDVAFLAVNAASSGDSDDEVRAFAASHHLSIPVALDPGQRVEDALRVHGTPTTLVVDTRGRVRLRRVGYFETAGFEDWLTSSVTSLAAEPR